MCAEKPIIFFQLYRIQDAQYSALTIKLHSTSTWQSANNARERKVSDHKHPAVIIVKV